MAGFVFALEAVLRHRKIIEEQRQRDLAMQLRHRMILQDQLRSMQETISRSRYQMADALQGRVNLAAVGSFALYSSQVSQRAQTIIREIVNVEARVDHARQLLLAATRSRQALELLKERRYDQWRRAQERRRTAELDEIALRRATPEVVLETA
ncbi:MAG: flagellar export protein FliJ [Phycisphaeraceae bacterium]|nr:flagellar export protein FliJ [Phycisphaeraceae bacterium]